jgi:hypothetical protein
MNRRNLLAGAGLGGAALFGLRLERAYAENVRRPGGGGEAEELKADLAVIGGGTGGCAAALAACRSGLRVIMTEETDWIGGQLTQQAVPPDEHRQIEQFGCTRAYRDYRNRVREYYRRNYPLTAEARARWNLNPGNGRVSRLCHEFRVGLAVLGEMMAPHVGSGRLTILLEHKPVAADATGDRVSAVKVKDLSSGRERTIWADYFIDATELGDLLPLTRTEYVTGAEAQRDTGEPHAPSEPQPLNMQAFTCCFAIDYLEGTDHTIEKPREYESWRDYAPRLTPPWPGRMLSFRTTHPVTLADYQRNFDPVGEAMNNRPDLWLFRRIVDKSNFVPGTYDSDVTLVNWPQIDYVEGNLCEVPEEEARRHLERAKQQSLSFLYWLQTEAPRPDGQMGWRGLRLRKDVVGTADGVAKYPYVRESRRIKAVFTVVEQHLGTEARARATGLKGDDLTSERFADSVGVGSYRIDLHPSSGKNNYIDVSSLPFQIPLGAIIPQRVENLLPGGKNLGVTHITNGCFRLHPVEWNTGEAAGMLAAYCMRKKLLPRGVRVLKPELDDFQKMLQDQGIEIDWPKIRPT